MSKDKAPKYVLDVLERLERRGNSAYLVGGCVRDIIMHRSPNDWDICTSALPEEVMAAFPHSHPTGIKHGTVTVVRHSYPLEVTTFRSDGDYRDHRRPENVSFIVDLEGDLKRRDFTINALAMPLSGEICDLFGGRADIENKLIRCVGDPDLRFGEDALRIFRALRFSAVLGFEIEPKTLAAIKNNAYLSTELAKERIRSELEKILLSNSPQVLADIIELGLLRGIILDSSAKSKLCLLKRLPKNRALRWAGLCALLLQSGAIDDAQNFLTVLRLDSATVQNCSAGCELAQKGAPSNALAWKKLLSENGTDTTKCAAAACELLYGKGHLKLLRTVIESGECFCLKQLKVTGNDMANLGFSGTEIGFVLSELLNHVIEFPDENKKDLLLNIAKQQKQSVSPCKH